MTDSPITSGSYSQRMEALRQFDSEGMGGIAKDFQYGKPNGPYTESRMINKNSS